MDAPERYHVPTTDGSPHVPLALDRHSRMLAVLRDRAFDEVAIASELTEDTARAIGRVLWMTAMTTDTQVVPGLAEADAAIDRCEPEALRLGVMLATFGRAAPGTYDAWVRAAFLANGLDPTAYHPDDRALVLRMLTQTGRAAPADRWVDSAAAARAWEES